MAIIGPIALYSNPPIEPQYFQPWRFVISGVTLGNPTIFTLTIPAITDLSYVVGQLVRIIIPETFGCRQLNGQTGYVLTVTQPNQISVGINSSLGVDPYVASSATTPAQVLAIGDINSGAINASGPFATGTYIPGSFIDVSPN